MTDNWTRWRQHIEAIEGEVHDLVQGDAYFRRSKELLRTAGRPTNSVYAWFLATYGRDAAIGLRRVLDTGKGVCSLRRLLEDISRIPASLSRRRFIDEYVVHFPRGNDWAQTASDAFTRLVEGDDDHIPKRLVQADLGRLAELTSGTGLLELTNLRIAHFNPNKLPRSVPELESVHEAVQEVERVCWRYFFLLKQVELGRYRVWNPSPDMEQQLSHFWLGEA